MPLRKVSHKLEIEKYNTVKTNKQTIVKRLGLGIGLGMGLGIRMGIEIGMEMGNGGPPPPHNHEKVPLVTIRCH